MLNSTYRLAAVWTLSEQKPDAHHWCCVSLECLLQAPRRRHWGIMKMLQGRSLSCSLIAIAMYSRTGVQRMANSSGQASTCGQCLWVSIGCCLHLTLRIAQPQHVLSIPCYLPTHLSILLITPKQVGWSCTGFLCLWVKRLQSAKCAWPESDVQHLHHHQTSPSYTLTTKERMSKLYMDKCTSRCTWTAEKRASSCTTSASIMILPTSPTKDGQSLPARVAYL